MLAGIRFLFSVSPMHEITGSSSEYTVFSPVIPRFFSSRLITFASGQTLVLLMSATLKAVGSSLFPVPIELMILTPALNEFSARAIFAETVSIASTT